MHTPPIPAQLRPTHLPSLPQLYDALARLPEDARKELRSALLEEVEHRQPRKVAGLRRGLAESLEACGEELVEREDDFDEGIYEETSRCAGCPRRVGECAGCMMHGHGDGGRCLGTACAAQDARLCSPIPHCSTQTLVLPAPCCRTVPRWVAQRHQIGTERRPDSKKEMLRPRDEAKLPLVGRAGTRA